MYLNINVSNQFLYFLGLLTSLTYLSVCSNQMTGVVPSEIGYLTNLYTLYLTNPDLTNVMSSTIGYLSKLSTVGFTFST